MPIYELRCGDCGTEAERYAPINLGKGSTGCDCGGLLRRVFTPPAVVTPWVPHFNHSVGQWVNNHREFRDALRRGEEEASIRTGTDHRYVEVSPQDARPATEEGLAEQQKAWHDRT